MSVSRQRICRMAAQIADAPDAEAALRTLALLRDELEEFERQQVAWALSEGGSFADVARGLNITRQAARRRYRDLSPRRTRRPADRPPASPEVRLVVAYARAEAVALRAAEVEPQHLLLAILRNGDRRAAAALEAAGATLEAARRESLAATRGPARSRFRHDGAAEAREVLDEAVRLAREEESKHVEVEHLLRGILRRRGAAATSLLAWMGVSPARVLAALEAGSPAVAEAVLASATQEPGTGLTSRPAPRRSPAPT